MEDKDSEIISDEELQSKWPGIKYASAFVVPSYQWMVARFEAADSRIQNLQAFIVTVTFGLLAVISAISANPKFTSGPFLAVILMALLAVILGVIGRSVGTLSLANPMRLYQTWLFKSELQFKKDMLFFAGEAFNHNAAVIKRKSNIALIMTLLFLAEMITLVCWIMRGV